MFPFYPYKPKKEWTKPANIIAVASLIALIVISAISAVSTNNANKNADQASQKANQLQEQLNNVLNSSLAQANSISNQSLAISNESIALAQTANNLTQNANDLNQQILNLQELSQNFSISVIPYPLNAKVYGDYWDISTGIMNETGKFIETTGNINVGLMIITPHLGKIHLIIENFTSNSYDPFSINPSGTMTNLVYGIENSSVSLGPSGLDYVSSYDEPIQVGAYQANFSIPAKATLLIGTVFMFGITDLPNQTFQIKNQTVPYNLGTIYFSGNLFDAQTQQTIPINFSVDLIVYINWHYR